MATSSPKIQNLNQLKTPLNTSRLFRASRAFPVWLRGVSFCALLTLIAIRLNPSWTFDPYGWVDQWGYVGQSYYFPDLRSAFPDAASGDLLPVVWPSALFFHLFGDLQGNLIRDFVFTVLTSSAIVLTVTRATRLGVGLVVGAFLFASQYFLTTSGSSYTDGHVAAYFAISIYFLSLSKTKERHAHLLLLSASGVFFALMVYSAVLSIAFIPVLALYFVFSSWRCRLEGRNLLAFVICYSLAFVMTTAALQMGYSTYGEGFFYENTIRKLFSFTVGNAYRAPAYDTWLSDASWLIVPAAVAGAAVAVLVVFMLAYRFKRVQLPKETELLLLAPTGLVILIAINIIVKQWSLQYLYFNQSLPIYYLTLGGLISLATWRLEGLRYWLAIGLASFFMTLTLTNVIEFTYDTLRAALFPDLADFPLSTFFLLIAILGTLLALMVFAKQFAPFALVSLVTAIAFSVTPSFGCFMCFDGFAQRSLPAFASSSEKVFNSTLLLSGAIVEADPNRTQKVWYSEFGELGPIFRQANAVTYLNEENNRISKSFPSLSDDGAPFGSKGTLPSAGDQVLLLSEYPDSATQALNVMKEFGFETYAKPTTKVLLEGSVPAYLTSIFLLSNRS